MKASTIKALAKFADEVSRAMHSISSPGPDGADLSALTEAEQALQSALKDELKDPYFEAPIKA